VRLARRAHRRGATVLLTEGGTAACIVAVMYLPLTLTMVLLPILGMMLNGTSSVLYGTVPEMSSPDRTERAFAIFYTGTIASGALAGALRLPRRRDRRARRDLCHRVDRAGDLSVRRRTASASGA
jgi:MFS family permease